MARCLRVGEEGYEKDWVGSFDLVEELCEKRYAEGFLLKGKLH